MKCIKKAEIQRNQLERERDIIAKSNEEKEELQKYERFQKREKKSKECIDIGWFFKIATSNNKIFVNSLKLH